MLETIAKLDAAVIRGVLITAVPVLGLILSVFGVDESLFSAKAEEAVDKILAMWTACGLAYIAYARITKPNPPLSDAAVKKTQEMISEGKLKVR